jgi:hypothetical protein
MGFYLIGPLVTLIPLGSISSWAFKPYCDDGLLGISSTLSEDSEPERQIVNVWRYEQSTEQVI